MISTPSTDSRLEWVRLPDTVLGVPRRFAVYLPPGYVPGVRRYPSLYLLRGHEDEWVSRQDGREGLRSVLDRSIRGGLVSPLITVMPGFMAPDRKSQGIPVNWAAPGYGRGVGNGRFEDHMLEILREVEKRFDVLSERRYRAVDGFSMGGYGALLLATRHPELFASVGAFDGSFMWPGQVDPRRRPGDRRDRLWYSETCASHFRRLGRWDETRMEQHNPLTIIARSAGSRLREIRETRFHLRTVGQESQGNVDRAIYVVRMLEAAGIRNSYGGASLVLSARARHTWKWADIHLSGTLQRHDCVFRGNGLPVTSV